MDSKTDIESENDVTLFEWKLRRSDKKSFHEGHVHIEDIIEKMKKKKIQALKYHYNVDKSI